MPPVRIDARRAGGATASFTLDIDPTRNPRITDHLSAGMLYEPDVGQAMLRIVRPGDTAIDVGANVGFFTCLMGAVVGPEGRVVACEPDPDNLSTLARNIALSDLHNVTLVTMPVTDVVGEVDFHFNSDGADGHALWDPALFPGNLRSIATPRIRHIAATTLDAEVLSLGLASPRLIKIDVEGAEHRVLQGAAGLLRGCRVPFVVAELHPFGLDLLGSSQMELRGFMAGFGYDTFALYYSGALPKLIPPGTLIELPHILNLLFSTPENVGAVWTVERHDPRNW